MSFTNLQHCFKAPRSRSNPRFPQTNDTQRHKGSDGKLYHQYNGDEDVNYRTVNENDNLLDSMRSMEMGRTLNMMAGKGDSRGHGQSKSATYVPPKLGTTSKSKKIERKAWEQEMGLTQTAPPASEMNTSSSHDQQLMEAIATLQHKYEENLQVIEQLYLEKKQMAKKVEILEYKLQKSMSPPKPRTASPVPPRYTRSVGKSQPPENQKPNKMNSSNRYHAERSREGERNNQSRLNATSPSLLEHVRNDDDDEYLLQGDQSLPESPNQDNFLNPSNAISALQAAEMFGEDAPVMTSRSAKSLPTRSSYEPPVNRMTKARPSSAPKMERYSASETPSRGRNPSITGVLSRPSSASRSIKSGPSATLQAETDRYLQKRKLFLDEEEQKKRKEREAEIEEQKRRQRAIRYGSAPSGMFQRDEAIRQKRLERQQKHVVKQEEDFLRTQQEIHREKLRNTRIRLSVDTSKTWEDIKREEEIKRKDRIEKRKEELLQTSQCSESLLKSVEKWKTYKSTEAEKPSSRRGSRESGVSSPNRGSKTSSLSPEEVTAALKRKQEKWEAKVKQQKLLLQANRKEIAPDHAAIELERRHLEYVEKWKKKAEEKKAQEEMEKRKKEEEERKHREKILQSRVPDGSTRLTKAAEERVKAVKQSTEKKQEEERKEKLKQEKKELRLKQTAEFLKSFIKKPTKTPEERENEIKRMAEEARRQQHANYIQNQKAINNKLSERPSLIERHDQAIAVAAAGTAALHKVAGAVQAASKFKNLSSKNSGGDRAAGDGDDDDIDEFSKKLNWKSKAATDDLFNEEEKFQLGLRE